LENLSNSRKLERVVKTTQNVASGLASNAGIQKQSKLLVVGREKRSEISNVQKLRRDVANSRIYDTESV
jgi:hypothetical protein